jgi:hypothetical protein
VSVSSDDDIDGLSDHKLLTLPGNRFESSNAISLVSRIDRLVAESLSIHNDSVYALPLYRNVKLQRDRTQEARNRELEQASDREIRLSLRRPEQQEIVRFQNAMDDFIIEETDLLGKVQDLKFQIEQQSRYLDSQTLKVDGRAVYLNGDHFVDENGNRLSESDEREAQRQLLLHPDAATWQQKLRIDELREEIKQTEEQIQSHIEQGHRDRDDAPALTPEQRKQAEEDAKKHAGDDKHRVGGISGKVGASAGDALTKELPFVLQPGGSGKGPPSGIVAAAPPELKDLPIKGTGAKPELPLAVAGSAISRLVDDAPSNNNHEIVEIKPNQAQSNRTTSYACGVLATTGKGDLSGSFGAAIAGQVDSSPKAQMASVDADSDKKGLGTTFAAAVTPTNVETVKTADLKVTPSLSPRQAATA